MTDIKHVKNYGRQMLNSRMHGQTWGIFKLSAISLMDLGGVMAGV